MAPPRSIAAKNWEQPLDVTLPVSSYGEIRVPFSRHVRQSKPSTFDWSFPHYSRLPAELQLRVLQCCDKPTLFQLMHTSRDIRNDSSKLFFSDPETWYRTGGDWLIQNGIPGGTISDIEFLARVERLYIDFGWMTQDTWAKQQDNEEETLVESHENMWRFWESLKRRCPQVTHVVLGDAKDRGNNLLPTIEYKNLAQLGPPNIEICISLPKGDGNFAHRLERKIWRRVRLGGASNTATFQWKECSDFLEPSVNAPIKSYCGPVGEYYQAIMLGAEWGAQKDAVRVHKIAAVEKYHLKAPLDPAGSETHRDGQQLISSFRPFECLASDCDAWFERPGEYTTHAIESGHDEYHDIPESFKDVFAVNEERLNRLRDVHVKRWRAVCDWWGQHGSEKQEVAKREYIHQLRNDPLWMDNGPDDDEQVLNYVEVSVNGFG
jgi:hypothetical protein